MREFGATIQEADAVHTTAGGARASWLDQLLAARDALVASAGFQRWAARFPLTRPIARRRSRALFDLCAGFVYSQVLRACVELDLFALLARGPLTIDQLAMRVALPLPAAERLVGAAVALRLLQRRSGNRIGLGALGAPLVGNESLRALIEHHALLYDDLRQPLDLLRRRAEGQTSLGRYYPYTVAGAAPRSEDVADYSALMSATSGPMITEALDAYSFAGHSSVMDVGGGEGRFARALAARWPHLSVTVFDLPAVAERAAHATMSSPVADRVTVAAGDFRSDALPIGADVITLVRILLDHDDETVLGLLRRVRAALPVGGRVVIVEPMAGVRGARNVGDAYFALYLFAMGSGRARSESELSGLCRAAGFSRCRTLGTHYPVSAGLLIADA
ncbi:MAG: methyltransferase [bacterium]